MADDDDLAEEVRRLRAEVDALQRRLESVESAVEPDAGDEPGPDAPPDDGADPIPRPTDETAPTATPEADAGETAAATPAPEPESSGSSETPTAADDLAADRGRDREVALGVRWLGVAGAVAVVVGVVFFVRLAVELGLLGPLGRVAAGTLGGLVLLGGGRYVAVRQGITRWGRIAAGTGLAVAYFSLYAAYGFETYREAIGAPLWAVVVALTVLVAAAAAVSVRDGAPLVAGEALLLGYVTAGLSIEAATVVLTPAYVLLLAAVVVALASVTPWSEFAVASVVGTYGVVGLWVVVVDPPRAGLAAVVTLAFLTYLGGSYALHDGDRTRRWYRQQLAALTLSNAVFGGVLLEGALQDALPEAGVEGLGAAAVAVGLAGLYAATDRRTLRRDHAAAAASVPFAAAAVRLAVGTAATTVGWLALLLTAVAVARDADAPAARVGGHALAAALAVKLLVVDATALPAFDAGDPLGTLARPAGFGLAVAVLYGLSWRFDAVEPSLTGYERSPKLSVDGGYAAVATALALALLGLELSGFAVSVAWALFGLALLAVGLTVDRRGIRLLGVGALATTTAKVFLYDTSDLDTVARTVSFLAVGAVLLVASYVYARSQGSDVELLGRD
jgi:uncharacterized membrane protein